MVQHENQRASTTVRGYRAYLERMLVLEFDGPLEKVTAERIDAYRRRLLAEEKLSRPRSGSP